MPSDSSALSSAVHWFAALLTGSVGTVIAVLAIAYVGFAMLQGRLAVREGGRIILGCFILFGAPLLAQGFAALVRGTEPQSTPTIAEAPIAPIAVPTKAPQFDPYAGASVPYQ